MRASGSSADCSLCGGLIALIASGSDQQAVYLPAIVIAAVPLAFSLIGKWGRPKFIIAGVLAAVLCVLILARLVPGQLDNGQMTALAQQMTFNTSLAQPDNVEYLENYGQTTPSPLWIYGAVVLVLGGLALANNRYPRAQRYMMYGAFALFALLAIGSLLDGIRYFRAFEDIALAAGDRNYHFALFRDVTRMWPDSNRVPCG